MDRESSALAGGSPSMAQPKDRCDSLTKRLGKIAAPLLVGAFLLISPPVASAAEDVSTGDVTAMNGISPLYNTLYSCNLGRREYQRYYEVGPCFPYRDKYQFRYWHRG
jgi:hypothetical protein